MTTTMLGSASIGDFDGAGLDMLIRQGFRPMPITGTHLVTPDVLSVDLSPAEAEASHRPGSHLEVAVPLGDGPAIRHYSLVGSDTSVATDRSVDMGPAMRIAILRETGGRGGSSWLHKNLPKCTSVLVRGPRDTFGYRGETSAYFVAGGIGITPITAMVKAAAEAGIEWHLLYIGRSRESMAFAEDLVRAHGTEKVTIHITEDLGRPDVVGHVREWAAEHRDAASTAATSAGASTPEPAVTVYTCGPVSLMEALEFGFRDDPEIAVIGEDFDSAAGPSDPRRGGANGKLPGAGSVGAVTNAGAATGDGSGAEHPFVVELGDGSEVEVPAGCSIIDALGQVGIRTLSSCQKGTCGTCETVILEGAAEHRDSVLSPEEHSAQETMMICVSRARGSRIALDL